MHGFAAAHQCGCERRRLLLFLNETARYYHRVLTQT